MFRTIAFGALVALLANGAAAEPASLTQQFADFKAKYGRVYKSAAEEAARFAVFAENVAKAAELQRQSKHATFGVTKFSDWTESEMRPLIGRGNKPKTVAPQAPASLPEMPAAPSNIDWRAKGAVNAVKNQGECGSCWAFGTIAATEGANFIANGKLVSLSEQQLVSGAKDMYGCNGGYASGAVSDMVSEFGGKIATEESYRYVSGNGLVPPVNTTAMGTVGAVMTGSTSLASVGEDGMAQYVATHGPIAIACDAENWSSYTGGVYDVACGTQLDHEISIVGYDDTAPVPYWIVRNSWSSGWGEEGYIFLKKGVNQCGVANQPAAVHVAKADDTVIGKPMPVVVQPSAPVAAGTSSVTQTYCDGVCTNVNCQAYTYALDTCIQMSGASVKIASGSTLSIMSFQDKQCRSFAGWVPNIPVNQCTIDMSAFNYTNTINRERHA